MDLKSTPLRRLFRRYVAMLLAQEATVLFEVDVLIVVRVGLLEPACVLSRVHFDLEPTQCVEAAFFRQAVRLTLLVEGLAAIEDLRELLFADVSHLLLVLLQFFAVVEAAGDC